MMPLNALAAFTQEVARTRPGNTPIQPAQSMRVEPQPAQRALEAVPPQPTRPLPRGSLLDLRV